MTPYGIKPRYVAQAPGFLVGLLLVLSGCSLTESELETRYWKHAGGYYLGDVMTLKSGDTLHQDTVFKAGKARALIVRKVWRPLGDGNMIEIISLKGNRRGTYIQN